MSEKHEWFLVDRQTKKKIAWNHQGDILLPGEKTDDEAADWLVEQIRAKNPCFESENVYLDFNRDG